MCENGKKEPEEVARIYRVTVLHYTNNSKSTKSPRKVSTVCLHSSQLTHTSKNNNFWIFFFYKGTGLPTAREFVNSWYLLGIHYNENKIKTWKKKLTFLSQKLSLCNSIKHKGTRFMPWHCSHLMAFNRFERPSIEAALITHYFHAHLQHQMKIKVLCHIY